MYDMIVYYIKCFLLEVQQSGGDVNLQQIVILVQSTMKFYASGIKRYVNFCSSLGQLPLPVTEGVVSAFVATLAKESICFAAISSASLPSASGQGDSGIGQMAHLEYVLKGIKRVRAYNSAESRKERHLITPAVLKGLFLEWNRSPAVKDAKMLWGAACLAFFGFGSGWRVDVSWH